MKKIVIAIIISFITTGIFAQSTLPDAVSKAFEQKFPKAKKVKWTSENIDDYQAEFVSDTVDATAQFTPTGSWIQTAINVLPAKLPPVILLAIKKNHPKTKVNKAVKIEHVKKLPHYEIELKKAEALEYIYFDLQGAEIPAPR